MPHRHRPRRAAFLLASLLHLPSWGCDAGNKGTTSPPATASAAEPAPGAEPELAPTPAPNPGPTTDPSPTTGDTAAPAWDATERTRVCREELIMDDEVDIETCEIMPGAVAVDGGGRAMLMKVVYMDPAVGDVTAVYLVYAADDMIASALVGEQTFVPGEEVTFEHGELRVTGDQIVVSATELVTIIGNTGDPDADPDISEERTRYEARCDVAEVFCERLDVD